MTDLEAIERLRREISRVEAENVDGENVGNCVVELTFDDANELLGRLTPSEDVRAGAEALVQPIIVRSEYWAGTMSGLDAEGMSDLLSEIAVEQADAIAGFVTDREQAKDAEIERLHREKMAGDAATLIVAEIAATIPLGQTLAKTQNTGEFIAYIKGKFDENARLAARLEKMEAAFKWACGEAPDPETGMWFGDEPHVSIAGKFWWRSKLRRIAALNQDKALQEDGGQQG